MEEKKLIPFHPLTNFLKEINSLQPLVEKLAKKNKKKKKNRKLKDEMYVVNLNEYLETGSLQIGFYKRKGSKVMLTKYYFFQQNAMNTAFIS